MVSDFAQDLSPGFAYAKIFMAALMEDVHLFVEGPFVDLS